MKSPSLLRTATALALGLLAGPAAQGGDLGAGAPAGRGAAVSRPPSGAALAQGSGALNVLLVILDDLGVEKMKVYKDRGHPYAAQATSFARMPNVEELADNGVVFANAYTNPVCSPSRAAIVSGRYGFRTGMGHNQVLHYSLPAVEYGIGEALALGGAAGYRSAAIGKWHLNRSDGTNGVPGTEDRAPIDDFGFDYFFGHISNLGAEQSMGTTDHYFWRRVEADAFGNTSVAVGSPAGPCDTARYSTSVCASALATWIAAQTDPWVVYWCPVAPHAPHMVPPHSLLAPETVAGQRYPATEPAFSQPLPAPSHAVASGPEQTIQWADAQAQATDTEIGNLLAGLPPAVLASTIIVVLGDNGSPSTASEPPYDSYGMKGTVREGGIRAPLIVANVGSFTAAVPGGTAAASTVGSSSYIDAPGRTSDVLVAAADAWATVLEIAGADVSLVNSDARAIDSISFAYALQDESAPSARTRVFCEQFAPSGTAPPTEFIRRAYRDGAYKYYRDEDPVGTVEERFYHIAADPFEATDLLLVGMSAAQQATFNQLRAEMRALVLSPNYVYGTQFCNASDGSLAQCPCANEGSPIAGCDDAQSSGGVHLQATAFAPDGMGHGTAEFTATGFRVEAVPAYVLLRSTSQVPAVPAFDGVLCLGVPVARLGAGMAFNGIAVEPYVHGAQADPGANHYQVWYRNQPVWFCNPSEPSNLSSGYRLVW